MVIIALPIPVSSSCMLCTLGLIYIPNLQWFNSLEIDFGQPMQGPMWRHVYQFATILYQISEISKDKLLASVAIMLAFWFRWIWCQLVVNQFKWVHSEARFGLTKLISGWIEARIVHRQSGLWGLILHYLFCGAIWVKAREPPNVAKAEW